MKKLTLLTILVVFVVGGFSSSFYVYAGGAGTLGVAEGEEWNRPSSNFVGSSLRDAGSLGAPTDTLEHRVNPEVGNYLDLSRNADGEYVVKVDRYFVGNEIFFGTTGFIGNTDLRGSALPFDSWDNLYGLGYGTGDFATQYSLAQKADNLNISLRPTYSSAQIKDAVGRATRTFAGERGLCADEVSGGVPNTTAYVSMPDGRAVIVQKAPEFDRMGNPIAGGGYKVLLPLEGGFREQAFLVYARNPNRGAYFAQDIVRPDQVDSIVSGGYDVRHQLAGATDAMLFRGFGKDYSYSLIVYRENTCESLPVVNDPSPLDRAGLGPYIPAIHFVSATAGDIIGSTNNSIIQQAEWQLSPCPEDMNGDGVINIIDLVTVARRFGQRVAGAPEDVNGDGNINIIDLVTIARKFGQRCPDAGAYISPTEGRVVFVPVPVTKQPQNTGFASVLKSILWVIGN